MEVVVYSNKNCMQCEQTKKHLEKNRQAPIVMAGDDVWVGFNLAKIKAVANAIAK